MAMRGTRAGASGGVPKSPKASGAGGATPKGGVGSNLSKGAPSHSSAGQKSGRPVNNLRQPKEAGSKQPPNRG